MQLATILLSALKPYHHLKTLWVAYSGGLDSQVLLNLLAELRHQIPVQVKAVHVNHGLSPNAVVWQEQCAQACASLGIPLSTFKVNAKAAKGESPEAAARQARYAIFHKLIQPGDALLTAHHQDDQAETLLLQLLRGAGVKGLAAMPAAAVFSQGLLLRPFLAITRAELVNYAQQHDLRWLEDESNASLEFDRNYLRHQVLPILQQRWPAAARTLTRSAQHCAEAAELIDALAIEDLALLTSQIPNVLTISKLTQLPIIRQKNVLRYWLAQLNFPLPNAKQLEQILHTVVHSAIDANPKVTWDQVEIRRFQDGLYALSSRPALSALELKWNYTKPLTLPNQLGTLYSEVKKGQGIKKALLPEYLTVRFRSGGERCHPQGRQGSHPLKKCMQEWKVPPWQRDQVPLLYLGEQLIAVIGYCVCEPYTAAADEMGCVFKLMT